MSPIDKQKSILFKFLSIFSELEKELKLVLERPSSFPKFLEISFAAIKLHTNPSSRRCKFEVLILSSTYLETIDARI